MVAQKKRNLRRTLEQGNKKVEWVYAKPPRGDFVDVTDESAEHWVSLDKTKLGGVERKSPTRTYVLAHQHPESDNLLYR